MVTLGFFEFFPTKPMCDVVYLQSRGTQCGVVGGSANSKELGAEQKHMMRLAHMVTVSMTRHSSSGGSSNSNEAFECDGTNYMWNNGKAAWQTVQHSHLHVIPRRKGDGFAFLLGFIKNILSLMGVQPPKDRNELDRLAQTLNGIISKHMKSS
jgi:hypothetical protein